jgi:hypothetical protein
VVDFDPKCRQYRFVSSPRNQIPIVRLRSLLTPDLDTTIYNLCILLLTDMVDSFVASMKTLLEEPTHSEGELTPNH